MSADPLPRLSSSLLAGPLTRDVILADGSTLRLRAPGPEDYDDVKAFYDRLSPESRYMRFHGTVGTDIPSRYVVEASGVDRVALICRHGDRVVAIANYDRLLEPGVAEIAFAVADDFRRRWTATRLLEQLAAIAAERGIRRFDAEVLADQPRGARRLQGGRVQGSAPGRRGRGHVDARRHTERERVGADRRTRPRRRGGVDAIGSRPDFDRDRGRIGRPWRIPAPRSCQTCWTAIFKASRCQSTERAV